jgi:hypothetical protein
MISVSTFRPMHGPCDLDEDKMHELNYDLEHAKEYKLYKSVFRKFKECKDIDELKDDEMKLLYNMILKILKN